jgi:hypothetical protein
MAQHFETSADEMVRAVRQQGLEGVIAKRRSGRYEAGKRSGSWAKYRVIAGKNWLSEDTYRERTVWIQSSLATTEARAAYL